MQTSSTSRTSESLDRAPEWALVLTGQDAGSHVARALGTRAAFLAWPLDVEQLQDLLASAEHLEELDDEEEVEADDVIDAPRPAYIPTPEEEEEMAEIEAILKAGGDEHDSPETDTLARDAEDFLDALESEAEEEEEEEDEFEEESEIEADTPPPAPASESALPTYYKAQIADLADIAQRLELSLLRLRETGEDDERPLGENLATLDGDVSRLVQFTRTMGYLASPPDPGAQLIDLSTLLEEFLGGFASTDDDAPRFLYRGEAGARVRSDKVLLLQAFDALLSVARACAGGGEIVRAVTQRRDGIGTDGDVEVEITFPAGPLIEIEIEDIQVPYGLRRVLPHIGPNALAAARGIFVGQGGGLDLLEPRPGQLRWIVALPAASELPAV